MLSELRAQLEALGESIEAAKRNCYGMPIIATESDTHPGKIAFWCDNGMAGCGQVAISVGEFPDTQVAAIAALANAAMAISPHLSTILTALQAAEAVEVAREALEPFAKLAGWIERNRAHRYISGDEVQIENWPYTLSVGELIAARQALAALPKEGV